MNAYRVLVTGSRNWRRPDAIRRRLDYAHDAMLFEYDPNATFIVVHGMARGADEIAHWYATECNWTTEPHPADWGRMGRRAGMVRNAEMVAAGAANCLAFLRDHSPGATACAAMAEQAGIPTTRIYDCHCHGDAA